MIPPPSPALSTCDSLDGIDDLDAFLASQGKLSHFPTPPARNDIVVEAIGVLQGLAQRQVAAPDDEQIALILAQQASFGATPSQRDFETIRGVLTRADLPLEVLAIALNILAGVRVHEDIPDDFKDTPPDLLLVAALSLAQTCTSDNPYRTCLWSSYVCDGTWTASRIDRTVLDLLFVLDFRLHSYCSESRLQEALLELSPATGTDTDGTDDFRAQATEPKAMNPLELLIDCNSSSWQHGQLTPDSCASPVAANCPLPAMDWLPLL